jgi:hypothetical protein
MRAVAATAATRVIREGGWRLDSDPAICLEGQIAPKSARAGMRGPAPRTMDGCSREHP